MHVAFFTTARVRVAGEWVKHRRGERGSAESFAATSAAGGRDWGGRGAAGGREGVKVGATGEGQRLVCGVFDVERSGNGDAGFGMESVGMLW